MLMKNLFFYLNDGRTTHPSGAPPKVQFNRLNRLTVWPMMLTLFLVLGVGKVWGQYSINFDGASDNTHASNYGFTNKNLNGITWTSLSGIIPTTPLAADWFVGTRSLRLRGYSNSHFTMTSNKADGAGTISFNYRR